MRLEKLEIKTNSSLISIETPCLQLFKNKNQSWFDKFERGSISSEHFTENFVKNIKGQFRIYLKNEYNETCILDRWSSIPSYSYKNKFVHELPNEELDELAAFSIFFSRRLWGNQSTISNVKKIPAGSSCTTFAENDKNVINRWHERDFDPLNKKKIEPERVRIILSKILNELDRYSLLLSGGLDTRTLLALSDSKKISNVLTLGFHNKSREIVVASQLAKLKNVEHKVVIEDFKHWISSLDKALSQSKFGYPLNSLFLLLPLSETPRNTGIGLDYMFQGMYLDPLAQNNDIKSLKDVLISLPCGNRYAGKYLNRSFKNEIQSITELVEKHTLRDKEWSSNYNDNLRKILFDDPSMHYSYTDYYSQSSQAKTIIPAFDNELDEIWQTIDDSVIFNKKFMLNILKETNQSFVRVKSANNDLPLEWNIFDRALLIGKNGLTKMFSKGKLEHQKRTWPTQGYMAKVLIEEKGKDFFYDSKYIDRFNWIDKTWFETEMKWFLDRTNESVFGVKHCDRENSLFYLLSILSMENN